MGDMTGDAPQPGETPRDDGTPWSHADPASPWWRADQSSPATDRPRNPRRPATPAGPASPTPTLEVPEPAQHTGEAAQAHRAGTQDVLAALTGEPPRQTEETLEVPDAPPAEIDPAEPRHARPGPARSGAETPEAERPDDKVVEQDHDRVDGERFNTEGEGTVYAARNRTRPPARPDREPTITELLSTIPVEPDPDVMVLPEPDRNRPTVALERTGVPGQPPSGLSRLGRAREDRARADRALQDRVRQERTAALLETSPFWRAEEERRAQAGPPPETREKLAGAGQPPRRRKPEPRRPVTGLLGLVALGLIAAFFAWVSAEPFWLAVGHGQRGTATVAECTGAGVTQRCTGQFTAGDGAYRVDKLALFGVQPGQRIAGASTPARMVSSHSRQAYAGSTGTLMHLRWALSFLLVLLCGLGIAGLTGARRLETARARRSALLLSVAGPLALLVGFLVAAY